MAIYKKKTSTKKGKTTKSSKILRRVPRKASKAVVSAVKSTIKSMAETKQVRMLYTKVDNTGIQPYNGTSWGLDNGLFALSPVQNRIEISQGDGEGQRTGNRITVKSSYLNLILYPTPYDGTYNPVPRPQDVMIIIYKIIGGGNTIQTTLGGLFQNGNVTSSPGSNLTDTVLPFNNDLYKILYKKIVKVGSADNTAIGNMTAYQYYANNDYKRSVRLYIPITKYLDKVIKYDNTSTTANNSMLYMAVLPMNADGSQPAAGNAYRTVSLIMNQTFKYVDL